MLGRNEMAHAEGKTMYMYRKELPTEEIVMSDQFYKFPRTPHIHGSVVVDDDRTISEKEFHNLVSTMEGIVQEKLDGANVGIHFRNENSIVLQKHSGIIEKREKAQYNVFRMWAYENMPLLWNLLHTKYVLFGEWLWNTHAVFYSKLPAYFIAYDLLEKETEKFLSYDRLKDILGGSLPIVPILFRGKIKNIEQLKALIKKSEFSDGIAEGVYVRFERGSYVIARCKLKRDTFVSGRTDFGKKSVTNRLIS